LASYTLAFALQLRKEHGKISVRVVDEGLRTSHFKTFVLTFATGFHKFAQGEWANKETLIIQVIQGVHRFSTKKKSTSHIKFHTENPQALGATEQKFSDHGNMATA
jgi:hypothetical protein